MIINYIKEAIINYIIMLPFFILFEFILCILYKRQTIKIKTGFLIGWQCFACFITAVLSITGAGAVNNIGQVGSTIIRLDEINLVPLLHWGMSDLFGLIMNIILFIPLGIVLPMLWKKGTSFSQTVLCGFIFSLLIELSQLFNWRATDIDDLIMNTLGAALGYGIYYLLFRKIQIFRVDNSQSNILIKYSSFINIVLFFILNFFVGKPFRDFIWEMLFVYFPEFL